MCFTLKKKCFFLYKILVIFHTKENVYFFVQNCNKLVQKKNRCSVLFFIIASLRSCLWLSIVQNPNQFLVLKCFSSYFFLLLCLRFFFKLKSRSNILNELAYQKKLSLHCQFYPFYSVGGYSISQPADIQ